MSLAENPLAEISVKALAFRSLLQKKAQDPYRPKVTFLGVFSDGTRYMVEDQTASRVFYLVTDLVSSVSFSNVRAGVSTGGGAWEIGDGAGAGTGSFVAPPGIASTKTGGFGLRKTANVIRNAMYFLTGQGIFLGDAGEELQLVGTDVQNSTIPWRNFNLDSETNVTLTNDGRLRRNDAAFIFQGCIKDNGNTLRYKSFCQLWENGQVAEAVGTLTYAVVFTNAQKDANYFVVVEQDDSAIVGTDVFGVGIDAISKTGFTISLSAAPAAGTTLLDWFAVRFGA